MERKRNSGFIVTIVLLVVVIIGLIGFICYDKNVIFTSQDDKNTSKTVSKKEVEDNNTTESTQTDKKIKSIDVNNCLNCSDKSSYYLINSGRYINEVQASYSSNDNTKGILTIDIDSYNKKAGTAYSLVQNQFEYRFQKEISDVMIYNIGQEELAAIVIFLMEDGTINYIDIYNQLENNSLASYKTLDKAKNIVKLYSASICSGNYCSSSTILAQTYDSTFYDLNSLINS